MLQLNNLKKYFANQKAVDDVSFEVQPGQIFGLLGPNGAGKTTLIRMITGIFYPDSGSIKMDGEAFNGLENRTAIGYMPEERGLYKKMKIGEQALYLAQLKGLTKKDAAEKVQHWFNKFEMNSWWNKKVEDLSKGMQQKLQFVTTVLHNPKLVILDEPFSGLDPVNANLIKDEIYRLAKNGTTIIFSTHRMEQVEEICDSIVLINQGKNILQGQVPEIKQRFKKDIFALTTANNQPLTNTELFNVLSSNQNQHTIKINTNVTTNSVLQQVINSGAQITQFSEQLPSLNEIFVELVSQAPTARQFDNQQN
jgi:ABC-2 type transport system ATP-binding protein